MRPRLSHLFAALWPNNEMQIEFRLRECSESCLKIGLECIHRFCVVPYKVSKENCFSGNGKKRCLNKSIYTLTEDPQKSVLPESILT